jgi:hypothetical protein
MAKVTVGEVLPAQELPQKKSLMILLKQQNSLVPISIGVVFLVSVVVIVSLIYLIVLNKKTQLVGMQTNNSQGNLAPLLVPEKFSNFFPTPKATPTPTPPTPTPTPAPLPSGPQKYSVNSANVIKVSELYISALDTKIGDSQTMSLTIQDPKGAVNYVSLKLITDKKSESHVLSLKSGTGSNGIWEGTWTTDDTHDYTYQAQITIKGQAGNTFSFEPSFR